MFIIIGFIHNNKSYQSLSIMKKRKSFTQYIYNSYIMHKYVFESLHYN